MRRFLLQTLVFVVCVTLALVLFILPFATFLGMAFLSDSVLVVSLIALFVFTCVGMPGMYWLSGRISKKRPRVAASVVLAILFLLTSISVYILLFQPLPGIDISMPYEPDGYWDLETGSRIAYRYTPAQGLRKPIPVIRLHGGYALPEVYRGQEGQPTVHPLNQLAEGGFDVYYYDQVGCGNSSRLENPQEYSVGRHVQDLEAIRKQLGSDKIIIVGLSSGSMLATQYAAAHPDRIAAIVFESPGWIWSGLRFKSEEVEAISTKHPEWKIPQETVSRGQRLSLTPRILFGTLILQINKNIASRIVSDKELSEFMGLMFRLYGKARCFYEPAKFPTQVPFGVGGYSWFMTDDSYKSAPDPRPILATITSPVLVIRGIHEWLPKRIAQDYVDTFPSAEFKELQDCGHLLCRERPEAYYRVVEEFVLRVSGESYLKYSN